MFDKYIIVGEEFRNIIEDGEVTGFQFGLRLPYYRGVVVSLVGPTELKVDGQEYSLEQMKLNLHGNTYKYSETEGIIDDKWEFGEVGIVSVSKPCGLSPGEHLVEVTQHVRIAYVAFVGSGKKILTIPG